MELAAFYRRAHRLAGAVPLAALSGGSRCAPPCSFHSTVGAELGWTLQGCAGTCVAERSASPASCVQLSRRPARDSSVDRPPVHRVVQPSGDTHRNNAAEAGFWDQTGPFTAKVTLHRRAATSLSCAARACTGHGLSQPPSHRSMGCCKLAKVTGVVRGERRCICIRGALRDTAVMHGKR